MPELDKKFLSERDICPWFITPALTTGGKWDLLSQIREEVYFTDRKGPLGAHLFDSTLHHLLAA